MTRYVLIAILGSLILCPQLVLAADINVNSDKSQTNYVAIAIFLLFVFLTLFITWRAAKKTKSSEAFFTAANGISPLQNAFALAGDFMSAATLLGITGLMFMVGYDGYILAFTIILGWTLTLVVVAERLRNLGKFTFVDVLSLRLQANSVRILMGICSLIVVLFYLIGQMVGAGKLIELLFGIDYTMAIFLVAGLMVLYVFFGGMIATTWVQMIKAGLLLFGGAFLSFGILSKFGFNFEEMLKTSAEIHPNGTSIAYPGGWLKNNPLNVWTVGLTMTFGLIGLPHVLMRFFTVKDGKGARKSVGYATIIMAVFYIFILIIGFGSIALIWANPEFYEESGALKGGTNMVALHASKVIGGDIFFGFMSAVAFATILAVVAGLTLAGSAAIAHDLYAIAYKKGKANPAKVLKLSKWMTLVIGAGSIVLGLAFETQNVAVVVAIALSIAASVNFPLLLLSMYWRGATSRGAVIGGTITLIVCLLLILLSHNVWVEVLGNETALFPYIYPTVFSMPLGFGLIWLFSILDKSDRAAEERKQFEILFFRSETGVGAENASAH